MVVGDRGAETLISQAREWESSGEYQRAVECYLKVTPQVTSDTNILEKCWVKASHQTLHDVHVYQLL